MDPEINKLEDESKNCIWRKFRIRTEKNDVYPPPYLNPWLRLMIYLLMIAFTGCVYWGWNGMQVLLYKAGSFKNLCDGVQNPTYINIGGLECVDCGARKSAINNLFTISYSIHLISSIFTGMILDFIGPKLCFIFGQAINFVSWILMSCCPKNPLVLRLCFFFIGVAAESAYIPLATVSHYFPGNQSLILSIMGSSRSISAIVPLVLSKIYRLRSFEPGDLYKLGIGYAVVCNLVCLFVGGLIIQSKFYVVDDKPDVSKSDSTQTEDGVTVSVNSVDPLKYLKSISNMKELMKHPQVSEFIMLVLVTSFFLTTVEFINKSHRDLLGTADGRTAAEVFKYVHTMCFIPGPLLGYLTDKFGAAKIFVFIQLSTLIYLVCTLTKYYAIKVIGCLFFMISLALCISDTYCYVRQRFSPLHFGVLNGICLLASGLLSLTNIPLYNLATKKLADIAPHNFIPVVIILMGYVLFCMMTSAILDRNTRVERRTEEIDKEF